MRVLGVWRDTTKAHWRFYWVWGLIRLDWHTERRDIFYALRPARVYASIQATIMATPLGVGTSTLEMENTRF